MLAVSLSENEFQYLRKKTDEKWVAIRIYSQKEEVKGFSKKHDAQFEDTLITYFTDIKSEYEEDGKLYKPFSEQNFNEIIEFVTKHQNCDKIFIHCVMGIQRSAGVVVGLGNQFDWIEPQHGLDGKSSVYPYPNVVCWFKDSIQTA